ncbi:MAG: hypothetical protein CVU77_07445 [Elusimicrobia bacterium HGW-Elusimicrobia-1]|jgi:multisubunit Na+/H+ antiporter MnhB subunit|nr:MAG: hypothetical protein CVU77_07445 [Elusimicrobia bacterium HGW-Elusimicrobia-1]
MNMEITLIIALIAIGSIVALELKDLLSCVIAVGVAGYGLSVIFLLLGAPDLAITQIVVEILALIILIRATVQRDTTRMTGTRAAALVLVAVFSIGTLIYFAAIALAHLPAFGSPLMKVSSEYIASTLDKVGAANAVSAIILDFRAIDTLGEATVLFTAAVAVAAIMRKTGMKPRQEKD